MTIHGNAKGNAHYHTQRPSEVRLSKGRQGYTVTMHPDVYIPQCPSEVRLSKGRKGYTVTYTLTLTSLPLFFLLSLMIF